MHRFTEQVKLAPRRIHIDIYLLYMNIIKQNHFIHFKEQAFPKHISSKIGEGSWPAYPVFSLLNTRLPPTLAPCPPVTVSGK